MGTLDACRAVFYSCDKAGLRHLAIPMIVRVYVANPGRFVALRLPAVS